MLGGLILVIIRLIHISVLLVYIITIHHIKFGLCSQDAKWGGDLPTQKLISGKTEIPAPSSAANTNRILDLSLFCPPLGKLVYHAIDFRQGYLRHCDGHIKV